MAVLKLDGDSSGAVHAIAQVTDKARDLKSHFDNVVQGAGQFTTELEKGAGAGGAFNEGLEKMAHHFMALAGPGALIAGAIHGIREYMAELERAANLADNLAQLSQLGPQALGEARGLIAAGVPAGQAPGIVQALQGAPAADAAFIRAAAPTNMFGNIGAMELSARAYEAQYGGTLPGLLGKSGAAFADTGLSPEQGIGQIGGLAAAFSAAGISGDAGLALTATMTNLFAGDAGKATQFIRGGLKQGVFADMPADVKADPQKMLNYIGSQFPDDESLGDAFGGRGLITAKALVGASAQAGQRFAAIQGTSGDASAMLTTAAGDVGLAAAQTGRRQAGYEATAEELPGLLRKIFLQEQEELIFRSTEGLSPILGGPARFGARALARARSALGDVNVARFIQEDIDAGNIRDPELLRSAVDVLKQIHGEVRRSPQPSGQQE